MRARIYFPALCLASATAFPQALPRVSPPPSAVCSIPLLSFTPGNIDPLIVKKLLPASDRTPQVRVPAPPCAEPAAQMSVLAQRLLEQKVRIKALQERFRTGAKPPGEDKEATPPPEP
jgi:hypothetical protein